MTIASMRRRRRRCRCDSVLVYSHCSSILPHCRWFPSPRAMLRRENLTSSSPHGTVHCLARNWCVMGGCCPTTAESTRLLRYSSVAQCFQPLVAASRPGMIVTVSDVRTNPVYVCVCVCVCLQLARRGPTISAVPEYPYPERQTIIAQRRVRSACGRLADETCRSRLRKPSTLTRASNCSISSRSTA